MSFIIDLAPYILAAISVFAPLIFTSVKDRHERRMKQQEFYYNYKFVSYKALITAHANMCVYSDHTHAAEFVTAIEVAASVSSNPALRSLLLSILDTFFKSGFKIKKDDCEVFILPEGTDEKIKKCIELISLENESYTVIRKLLKKQPKA